MTDPTAAFPWARIAQLVADLEAASTRLDTVEQDVAAIQSSVEDLDTRVTNLEPQ